MWSCRTAPITVYHTCLNNEYESSFGGLPDRYYRNNLSEAGNICKTELCEDLVPKAVDGHCGVDWCVAYGYVCVDCRTNDKITVKKPERYLNNTELKQVWAVEKKFKFECIVLLGEGRDECHPLIAPAWFWLQ